MIAVDDKVRFDPFATVMGFGVEDHRQTVTGTVVAVNYGHKWFSVEYGCPAMRTSFKFTEIGKDVKVVG